MRRSLALFCSLLSACIGRRDADGDGFADCSVQYWPLYAYLDECSGEETATLIDTADTDCPGGCEMNVVTREFGPNADCDDGDPDSHPDGIELCDRADNDCNGLVDDGELDCDGDGITLEAGDCNDDDKAMQPGHVELCDGRDNDCDGEIDEDSACPS